MSDNSTKTRIIDAMYDIVANKGYDGSSISQIAEAVGVKKASIYYYFASKEEIFLAMVLRLYADDYPNCAGLFSESASPESYRKALTTTGEQFIDGYYKNHNLRKVYAEIDIQTLRMPKLAATLKSANKNLMRFLRRCMTRGVEISAFPADFDTELNAKLLYTLFIGIDQLILYDIPIDPKQIWSEAIAKLF